MKFLLIGLGSMGKRRVRNLLHHQVKPQDILGVDLSSERCAEVREKYHINTANDFLQADDSFKPDAYIISTPPHLHAQYFLHAAKQKKHFFVEVATTDVGYDQLEPLLDGSFVAAPSFTFRYNEAVKKLHHMVVRGDIGRVWAFNHHLGQYLPDWHPWEDYRSFYVSQPESSACREMVPYELQWIQWVIQDRIKSAVGITGRCSNLELTIDDTYTASLRSESGILGTLMVDIIARPAVRVFRILGSEGTLEWDWQRYVIRRYSAAKNKWFTTKISKGKQLAEYKTTTEDMYHEELGDFLSAIQGSKAYPYTFAEDAHNFALLRAMEKKY